MFIKNNLKIKKIKNNNYLKIILKKIKRLIRIFSF